jgi:hypothetical protein
VDWIQDDVHWRAVVTTVMNVMLLKKWAISWPAEWLSLSQGLDSFLCCFVTLF